MCVIQRQGESAESTLSLFGEHKGQAEPLGGQQEKPRSIPTKSAGLRGDAIETESDCGNNRKQIGRFNEGD